MGLIHEEKAYALKIRESANDGSDFSNPDADYRIAFLGEDGLWHVKDSAGAVTSPYSSGSLGAWTDYTPTLTASSVNPTVGNGTIAGRYKELDDNTVAIVINWVFGSTSAAGTGTYAFALPGGMTSGARVQVLAGILSDEGTRRYVVSGRLGAGATTIDRIGVADASGAHVLSNNVPITWATSDELVLSGTIEIA